jgi:hypothetical protein
MEGSLGFWLVWFNFFIEQKNIKQVLLLALFFYHKYNHDESIRSFKECYFDGTPGEDFL